MDLLRSGSRAVGLGAVTAGFLAAEQLHEHTRPEPERPEVFQRYMKVWARACLSVFGVQLHVAPSAAPPLRRARLVVANHRSPLDVAALLATFGGHALSRADMAGWPILGVAARKAGTIFVDRQDANSGATAIRRIRARLELGRSVLVFPEGGTFAGDVVQPFKRGTFVALSRLDAEVVPVGLAYPDGAEFTNESFLEHVRRVAVRPTLRICMRIGAPIPSKGVRSQDLAQEAHAQVQRLVHEARADWRAAAP